MTPPQERNVMRLEYFKGHGRAMHLRMIMWYCNIDYDDCYITEEEFFQNKREGKYPASQVPVLYLEDGQCLSYSYAIARYLGRTFLGRNDEFLYPGASNPEMIGQIDEIIGEADDLLYSNYIKFQYHGHPEYKNKDKHIADFENNYLQTFLQKVENKHNNTNYKYLCGDECSLADIIVASHFLIIFCNNNSQHKLDFSALAKFAYMSAWFDELHY